MEYQVGCDFQQLSKFVPSSARVPVRDKNDSHKSLHCAKRVCFLNIWQLDCRDAQVAWNAKEGSRAKDQNRFKVLATAK